MVNAMAANFEITSSAFKDGGKIPVQYSCVGKDISPQLAWSNAPAATQSFALICSDPDAPMGTWYHWVIFNIPKTLTEIPENNLPTYSLAGKNSWQKMQYNGPCPPPSQLHHYIFTLFSLDSKLNLPQGVDVEMLKKAMQGHIIQSTTITGLFSK